jgi:uncharacterized membrane protein
LKSALAWVVSIALGAFLGFVIWWDLSRQSFWPKWAKGQWSLAGWVLVAIAATFGIIQKTDRAMRKNLGQ